MSTSFPRVFAALLALVFVLAACASDTGTQWTFAPLTASEGEQTTESTTDTVTVTEEQAAPAEPTGPAEAEVTAAPVDAAEMPENVATEAPAEPAEPSSGEPRVIDLQADSALRFTDMDGQPVPEIAVTPGETILFRIDNTAGFQHNFWIGEDSQLSVPAATTDVGIPDWTTGTEELEWVVPDDITDLKFACTVPGHYFTMQGVFTLAGDAVEPAEPAAEPAEPAAEPAEPTATEEPAEPAATEPAEPAATEETAEVAAPADGEARVIELEADAAIRFLQDGSQIQAIEVTPGETVIFRVDNTAGFAHNFYIGADDDLRVMGGTTDIGIPDWDTGVQELEWVVPEDLTGVRFACTVPGHYFTMNGDFVVTP
jgi:azurin